MRNLVLAMIVVTLSIGCKSNSLPTDLTGDGGGNIIIDCNKAWMDVVEGHHLGMLKEIKVVQSVTMDGATNTNSEGTQEEEILESNQTKIVKKRTTTQILPPGSPNIKNVIYTKSEFFAQCELLGHGDLPELPDGVSVGAEIIEQGDETIVVEAGSFDCRFYKTKVTSTVPGQQVAAYVTHWTSKLYKGLMVKMQQRTPIVVDGKDIILNTDIELINFHP